MELSEDLEEEDKDQKADDGDGAVRRDCTLKCKALAGHQSDMTPPLGIEEGWIDSRMGKNGSRFVPRPLG